MKRYKPLKKLQELTLADLKSNQGVSDFTLNFKKERNGIMGSESRVSSLANCILQPNGDVDFIFISEATDKYSDDYTYQKTPQYKNYDFISNPEKTYEVVLRIKDVLEWLDTFPNKTIITEKDIKDILDISEIEISSSNPSWYWQGMAYYLQQLDGTIDKKQIKKPKFWNKSKYHGDGNAFLDKIAQSIINQIAFYRNQMASKLTKKLKYKGII